MKQGLLIKINSTIYTVKSKNLTFNCVLRGKFRNNKITPLVGDKVLFDENELVINEILERKNYLLRPPVSNVDICLIVTSLIKPNINMTLLDKLISIVIINKIKPVIVLTKQDLLSKSEKKNIKNIIKYYNKIGIPTLTNKDIRKLKKIVKGKIVTVCGQTGAGKSTLINKFDKKLNLKTDEISEALGRGKHTTRHTETFKYKNSYISDTPGFSSLDLTDLTKEDIKNTFIEFSNDCYFSDCNHLKENKCVVKEKVNDGIILKSRYDNYVKMVDEVESKRIIYKK